MDYRRPSTAAPLRAKFGHMKPSHRPDPKISAEFFVNLMSSSVVDSTVQSPKSDALGGPYPLDADTLLRSMKDTNLSFVNLLGLLRTATILAPARSGSNPTFPAVPSTSLSSSSPSSAYALDRITATAMAIFMHIVSASSPVSGVATASLVALLQAALQPHVERSSKVIPAGGLEGSPDVKGSDSSSTELLSIAQCAVDALSTLSTAMAQLHALLAALFPIVDSAVYADSAHPSQSSQAFASGGQADAAVSDASAPSAAAEAALPPVVSPLRVGSRLSIGGSSGAHASAQRPTTAASSHFREGSFLPESTAAAASATATSSGSMRSIALCQAIGAFLCRIPHSQTLRLLESRKNAHVESEALNIQIVKAKLKERVSNKMNVLLRKRISAETRQFLRLHFVQWRAHVARRARHRASICGALDGIARRLSIRNMFTSWRTFVKSQQLHVVADRNAALAAEHNRLVQKHDTLLDQTRSVFYGARVAQDKLHHVADSARTAEAILHDLTHNERLLDFSKPMHDTNGNVVESGAVIFTTQCPVTGIDSSIESLSGSASASHMPSVAVPGRAVKPPPYYDIRVERVHFPTLWTNDGGASDADHSAANILRRWVNGQVHVAVVEALRRGVSENYQWDVPGFDFVPMRIVALGRAARQRAFQSWVSKRGCDHEKSVAAADSQNDANILSQAMSISLQASNELHYHTNRRRVVHDSHWYSLPTTFQYISDIGPDLADCDVLLILLTRLFPQACQGILPSTPGLARVWKSIDPKTRALMIMQVCWRLGVCNGICPEDILGGHAGPLQSLLAKLFALHVLSTQCFAEVATDVEPSSVSVALTTSKAPPTWLPKELHPPEISFQGNKRHKLGTPGFSLTSVVNAASSKSALSVCNGTVVVSDVLVGVRSTLSEIYAHRYGVVAPTALMAPPTPTLAKLVGIEPAWISAEHSGYLLRWVNGLLRGDPKCFPRQFAKVSDSPGAPLQPFSMRHSKGILIPDAPLWEGSLWVSSQKTVVTFTDLTPDVLCLVVDALTAHVLPIRKCFIEPSAVKKTQAASWALDTARSAGVHVSVTVPALCGYDPLLSAEEARHCFVSALFCWSARLSRSAILTERDSSDASVPSISCTAGEGDTLNPECSIASGRSIALTENILIGGSEALIAAYLDLSAGTGHEFGFDAEGENVKKTDSSVITLLPSTPTEKLSAALQIHYDGLENATTEPVEGSDGKPGGIFLAGEYPQAAACKNLVLVGELIGRSFLGDSIAVSTCQACLTKLVAQYHDRLRPVYMAYLLHSNGCLGITQGEFVRLLIDADILASGTASKQGNTSKRLDVSNSEASKQLLLALDAFTTYAAAEQRSIPDAVLSPGGFCLALIQAICALVVPNSNISKLRPADVLQSIATSALDRVVRQCYSVSFTGLKRASQAKDIRDVFAAVSPALRKLIRTYSNVTNKNITTSVTLSLSGFSKMLLDGGITCPPSLNTPGAWQAELTPRPPPEDRLVGRSPVVGGILPANAGIVAALVVLASEGHFAPVLTSNGSLPPASVQWQVGRKQPQKSSRPGTASASTTHKAATATYDTSLKGYLAGIVLSYDMFCDVLVIISVMRTPAPWISLASRVAATLSSLLRNSGRS